MPHSQVPATCPCPEPTISSLRHTSYFLKAHLNIILPPKPGSSKWSLSSGFPPKSWIHLYSLSYVLHAPPTTTPLPYNLILSSNLCLGLPSGLLPSGSPNNTLYILHFTPTGHTPIPPHTPWFDRRIHFDWNRFAWSDFSQKLWDIAFILSWWMRMQNNNLIPMTS